MMPRWLKLTIAVLVALSFVPLVLAVRYRTVKKSRPRIHRILNMDNQPSYKTQQANPLFADGRAMRPHVDGTVARGHLEADDALHLGRDEQGAFIDEFPLELDAPLLARGQERFNIYCAPCHGDLGKGDGPVHQRAGALGEGTWTPPTDLTGDFEQVEGTKGGIEVKQRHIAIPIFWSNCKDSSESIFKFRYRNGFKRGYSVRKYVKYLGGVHASCTNQCYSEVK